MLSYETGPFDLFERLRIAIGMPGPGEPLLGFLPGLFSCVWCIGVYTATAMWIAWEITPIIPALVATWTVAIMAERWNRG